MSDQRPLNLQMPGNPRYQPDSLKPYLGYDHIMRGVGEVEIATLEVLGELGVIPDEIIALLTPEIIENILNIRTTDVDKREREVTRHDIRAWGDLARAELPPQLRRFLHIPLTSYDVIDTGRILMFRQAYRNVVYPLIDQLLTQMSELVRQHAQTVQTGRTHGQHAVPITAGFAVATTLDRIIYCASEVHRTYEALVGKISGPTGTHNAEKALGISDLCGNGPSFEQRVLKKVGLKPARISTQILPPEPLAQFLHALVLLSATLGQFGRDGQALMRSEIGEMSEPWETGQVGSSTMPNKRNPTIFEQLEGKWKNARTQYGLALETMISTHQRDLVGSSIARDFPVIVVILVTQLEALLKKNKKGKTFLERVTFDKKKCKETFLESSKLTIAEAMYTGLQLVGYEDAHELINSKVVGMVQSQEFRSIQDALTYLAREDEALNEALKKLPAGVLEALSDRSTYIGFAPELALQVAIRALQWTRDHQLQY